ncbi:MAG: SbcC/MukB-like Walker B domain-containing protein [Candidatus Thiodiazotropha endolucinida]
MKSLTRIIFINWYLFEADEWEIRGHTALIGANGAGKSSFLDAIQYVMLGGNRRDWKPNAKAPDKHSERDIRGYVLGLVKTEDAIGENSIYQPRDDALCRIGLVFTDDVTGEPTTVGAAISARRDDAHEEVEGFFILEGVEFTLYDFLDKTELGHLVPRPYTQLKALFKQGTPEQGCFLFGREPEKYVDQLTRSLCHPDFPPDTRKYRRAFKQSISMTSLDGSVSDFVKTSILDAEPIDIAKMRDSLESYKRKKEAVVRTKKQIEQLAQILHVFKSAKSKATYAAAYEWCAAELEFEALDGKIEALKEEMWDLYATYRKQTAAMHAAATQLKDVREKRDQVKALIEADENETQRKLLLEKKNNFQKEIERIKETLKDIRGVLALSTQVVRYRDLLNSDFAPFLDQMARHAVAGEGQWPLEPSATDRLVDDSRKALEQEKSELFNRLLEVGSEHQQAEQDRKARQERLENIRQGKSDLNRDTVILMRALQERGIVATPVCELIEISDERWQPAIEAFLRNNAEALVVDPEEAKEAVSIYRGMKRQGLYNAVVVNTKKVRHWVGKDIVRPGTAADLIQGENPYAVAYLQRLLLNIDLVEETKALVGSDRALTPDGMFARQGGIQRLRLPDLPKIGKTISQRQIALLEQKITEIDQQRLTLKQSKERHQIALGQLNDLFSDLKKIPSTKNQIKSLVEAQNRVDELETQISAIDLSHTEQLRNELGRLDVQILELTGLEREHAKNKQTARTKFSERGNQRKKDERLIPQFDMVRKEVAAQTDYDAAKAEEVLGTQQEKHALDTPEDYQKVINHCRDNAKKRSSESSTFMASGQQKAATYNAEYGAESVDLGGFLESPSLDMILKTVQVSLENLEDLGLHTREEEASNALREVERVIRQDLAIRLRNQISSMKRRIRELNDELKSRPFSSNQIYQFRFDRKPEYTDFIDFVERVNEYDVADFGGLFDPHQEQFEVIRQMLETDDDEELKDYRSYYRYDIEIIDEEAGIKEMLSRKKGAGSGGEQRSPFYVAMGASLASAYRINREVDGSLKGGLSLYLADEAFQSMDLKNTMQAANYLKSIGLQLFIAAPDESEPRMTAVVDTVLFFIRDGVKATVDVQHLKEKLRKLVTDSLIGSSKPE